MKILAIDDSCLIRRIIESTASVLGAQCVPVSDPQTGLRELQADPSGFSLVCIDCNAPNSHGIQFLTDMRADERWLALPVLMFTPGGSRDAMLEAIKAGATAFMPKPFVKKDLQAKMLGCLGLGTVMS
jgi:two-component system chemotaxis response regulator CheY